MAYQHILIEHAGGVATVTMNRPQRRNALCLELMSELTDALRSIGRGDAVGVIVAGNGPVFCAGHDLNEFAGASLSSVRRLLIGCTELMTALQSIPQVVIARVHGMAAAAGCQLVASCDLAVASDSATFMLPGGKAGWFCHTPLVALARSIGRKRALEMALTGDAIDAGTAADWGLINQVAPAAELDAQTHALMARATRGSAFSKGLGKAGFYAQVDLDQPKAYAYAVELMASTSQTADAQERIRAFIEKRAPIFSGR